MGEDIVVEAIIKIGNSSKVINITEPDICNPFKLEEWMVRRVLEAEELLHNDRKQRGRKKSPTED